MAAPAQASDQIIVNVSQKGNPLLKYLKHWNFGETAADYQLEGHTAVLFLQLKFHALHKDYLLPHMRAIGALPCRLKVLLCLCDVEDSNSMLIQIEKHCIEFHMTLLVCWTSDEAAAYLSSFRKFANRGPELLQARRETHAFAAAIAALTQVRSINKTDVANLFSTFGSLRHVAELSEEDLLVCPGLGEKKVKRLLAVLDAPFPGVKRRPKALASGLAGPSEVVRASAVASTAADISVPTPEALHSDEQKSLGRAPVQDLPSAVPISSCPHYDPLPPALQSEKGRELQQRRAAVQQKGYSKMRSALQSALKGDEDEEEGELTIPVIGIKRAPNGGNQISH